MVRGRGELYTGRHVERNYTAPTLLPAPSNRRGPTPR